MAKELYVSLVNLAKTLLKSSALFLDFRHVNNVGYNAVGKIKYRFSKPIFSDRDSACNGELHRSQCTVKMIFSKGYYYKCLKRR